MAITTVTGTEKITRLELPTLKPGRTFWLVEADFTGVGDSNAISLPFASQPYNATGSQTAGTNCQSPVETSPFAFVNPVVISTGITLATATGAAGAAGAAGVYPSAWVATINTGNAGVSATSIVMSLGGVPTSARAHVAMIVQADS